MDKPTTQPKYRVQFTLKPGDVVHVNGLPFEYLGDAWVGGNTPPGGCGCADLPEGMTGACSRCSPGPEESR